MPPATVWESEVQIKAAVVFTIASFGPGLGTGFSVIPTAPISFITNAFIVVAPSELCVWLSRPRSGSARGWWGTYAMAADAQHRDDQSSAHTGSTDVAPALRSTSATRGSGSSRRRRTA